MLDERRSYNYFYSSGGWSYNLDSEIAFFKKYVEPIGIKPCKVLDIGCGLGFHSNMLHCLGYDVTGVDISDVGINKARELYKDINFVCSDLKDFTTTDQFDLIYARGTGWYHFELQGINKCGINIEEETHRLFTMLRPGGIFLLLIATDFSGTRPDNAVHNNTVDDYVNLFIQNGEVIHISDWAGNDISSGTKGHNNIIIATRKSL